MAKEMSVGKASSKISDNGAAIVQLTTGDALASLLASAGIVPELVGGTLPKLEWSTPGEARLLRFENRKVDVPSEEDGKFFNIVSFAELDPAEYAKAFANGDKAGNTCSVKGRGYMAEGVALGDYFESRATVGDIVAIIFGGTEDRAKNHKMNHFTVQRLYAAPRGDK